MSRLFVFAALLLVVSPSIAQDSQPTVGISATAMYFDDDPDSDLKREATQMFKSVLSKYELPYDGDMRVVFFINLKEAIVNGENQVIFSIVEGHSLPPEVIDLAAENETFYSGVSEEDLSAEGKWVREYVTREQLKYFFNFQGYVMDLVKRSELESFITAYVEGRLRSMKMI